MHRLKFLFGLAALLGAAMTATGQAYPPAQYRSDVPTLAQTIGHDHGQELTTPAEMITYFRALADAESERMLVRSYGETWQGRELVYAVISSDDNMQRLDAIMADLAAMGAGETLTDDQIEQMPAVVWLSYGVHGDEITPPDSAMFMAYHLLAAENDALVDTIMDNTIIIIDPSQNPDGRARFIHSFLSARGLEPQADRYAVEHDQPWPRGRFNHYLFDLNRDWFALTQPETRGKIKAVQEWQPVLYVDSHEMSGDSTYFFPPSARPFNPNITSGQRTKQADVGRTIARYFDQYGAPYFTREVFDLFYPGYGDTWPTLNGAVAMTFEQGSPRGLVFDRSDGSVLTYNEGVRNNVLSSLGTLETVARNKQTYLRDYSAFRRSAISEAQRASDRYVVLDRSSRRHESEALARRLAAQGIAVQRTAAGTQHCGATYSDGAFVIDLAQPSGRLARTLLSRTTDLADDYIADQEDRRTRGLHHELYDVTAWSMPLMDGVTATQCNRADLRAATAVSADDPIPAATPAGGAYGMIVPWSDGGQAQLVIAALKAGLKGKTTNEPFTQAGQTYPSGSVIFPVAGNPADMKDQLRRLATEIGAELVAMENSWVEDGPNFGSGAFAALKTPRVALAWGDGTSAPSAGNTRFVIERVLGLPVAPIRTSTLARADLSKYDVLILPHASAALAGEIGDAGAIQEFVREGGVLVAISGSIDMLAGEDYGLLSTRREEAANSDEDEAGAEAPPESGRAPGLVFNSDADYHAYIHDHHASPEDVPGVLLRAVANTDHWLAAGYDAANVLVAGNAIYRPLVEADGVNVFRFTDADTMLLSGYLWEENHAQLAYKPFVMAQRHGDGVVIGFTQSPTTRAYLNGLNLLLANAIVLGPARMAQ